MNEAGYVLFNAAHGAYLQRTEPGSFRWIAPTCKAASVFSRQAADTLRAMVRLQLDVTLTLMPDAYQRAPWIEVADLEKGQ